jgi:hypothetical protein
MSWNSGRRGRAERCFIQFLWLTQASVNRALEAYVERGLTLRFVTGTALASRPH